MTEPSARQNPPGRTLAALTIFLSAFLLFAVEPLIAKMILPWFGGSPAVWTAAMPIRLDARAPDFAANFSAFLDTKREASADVEQAVRAIIADVAARGDAALLELTQKFDRVDFSAIGMRVTFAVATALVTVALVIALAGIRLSGHVLKIRRQVLLGVLQDFHDGLPVGL